jgi:hypothetical protein
MSVITSAAGPTVGSRGNSTCLALTGLALTVWPFTESRSMMAARTGDATAATKLADHPLPRDLGDAHDAIVAGERTLVSESAATNVRSAERPGPKTTTRKRQPLGSCQVVEDQRPAQGTIA